MVFGDFYGSSNEDALHRRAHRSGSWPPMTDHASRRRQSPSRSISLALPTWAAAYEPLSIRRNLSFSRSGSQSFDFYLEGRDSRRDVETTLEEEEIHGADTDQAKRTLLQLSCVQAMQTFCNALIQADVPALLMEVMGQDAAVYTSWFMWQNGVEQLLELLATASACALSDAVGRRPVLLLTGPLELCIWAFLAAFVPRRLSVRPALSVGKALASTANTAFLAVSGSAICDALRGNPEALADTNAATQSYVGLCVIFAPLLSVFLRRRMGPRAPFLTAGALSGLSFLLLLFALPETLRPDEQTPVKIGALNPIRSATLLLRQSPPVAVLAAMYSVQSLTRCVDVYLQPFTGRVLGWGRNEIAQLLSWWGFCVFIGSRCMKLALKRWSARTMILIGTLSSAGDFAVRAWTTRWWHHPAALVVGLPGICVEPAMRALVASSARRQCPRIGGGATQAALKMQQTLTLALVGAPLFGRAFAWWLRQKKGSFPATHYLLACACGVLAHLLLWSAGPLAGPETSTSRLLSLIHI